MLKGLLAARLQIRDLLRQRMFRTHIELPKRWAEYYEGTVRTMALPVNRRHRLRYAF
jgi:hypothetical protein